MGTDVTKIRAVSVHKTPDTEIQTSFCLWLYHHHTAKDVLQTHYLFVCLFIFTFLNHLCKFYFSFSVLMIRRIFEVFREL